MTIDVVFIFLVLLVIYNCISLKFNYLPFALGAKHLKELPSQHFLLHLIQSIALKNGKRSCPIENFDLIQSKF